MSLDKAIEHGKEKRKKFRGGKAVSNRCKNHGGCVWCEANRLYQRSKEELAAEQQMREVEEETMEDNLRIFRKKG
ncbi:hypothetical protein [Anaerotignum sp.]